jgi:threonine dehydrogenase-like Zn-dependent dehydrogenase
LVTAGSDELTGRTVFCLHPHQDTFQVAEDALVVVPAAIPAKRATLAANMETALNAHWDAGTGPGDRVAVIGAGIVGLLAAAIASKIAGTKAVITDIDPQRASLARALGLRFVSPGELGTGNRIVFHTTGTAAGLQTAIGAAAFEGRIIELSWYGSQPVSIALGGAFHSRRLAIICSQVGHVANSHRGTMTRKQRLETAMSFLDDPRLDALVSNEIAFEDVPGALPDLLFSPAKGLPPVIRYPKT